MNNRIFLFENRRDIPVFLNTMNVYFFPSITEGQPNALIEAMLMGLPFTASDIDPIKETVGKQDKYTLLSPNDIDGFFLILEGYYSNGVQKDELLKNNTSKKFDYKVRFNQFYNTLLK